MSDAEPLVHVRIVAFVNTIVNPHAFIIDQLHVTTVATVAVRDLVITFVVRLVSKGHSFFCFLKGVFLLVGVINWPLIMDPSYT